MKDDTDILIAS